MTTKQQENILKNLNDYFNLSQFREGQEEAINGILDKKDTLLVMPTGSGKSLCYQLPALCLNGLTIVISPLISLMQDQVDALIKKGIKATHINSSLSPEELQIRLNDIINYKYKLIYLSPERFNNKEFNNIFKDLNISLLVIDEAHCISQWGHDFRPCYRMVEKTIKNLKITPIIVACTATATLKVQEDIIKSLDIADCNKIIKGFKRDNLKFKFKKSSTKVSIILKYINEYKTGIIYCSTKKDVETIYKELKNYRISCNKYHAGMTTKSREKIQKEFMNKEINVIVATCAFGMGIDRSDIRFVIHYKLPGTIEAYYQEAGRAGRDGEMAVCLLLYKDGDEGIQEYFIENQNPYFYDIERVYSYLKTNSHSPKILPRDIEDSVYLDNRQHLSYILTILKREDIIVRYPIVGERAKGIKLLKSGNLEEFISEKELKAKKLHQENNLEYLLDYTDTKLCRQKTICAYFGEDIKDCGICDNCSEKEEKK